jgi:fatty-acyl-CoA synthase
MRPLKDDGEWAKIGELGELCITGPQVIPGYMEEKHNEGTFFYKDSARWMKTGDTGYMDEIGYMHYVGRCKEMYISGGYNVYPPEIEKYISAHEKVNAVAVLGVDDPVWGEIGYAFVQLEQGAEMAAEEVTAYCKEGLAGYKVPKKIFIRTELPKTAVGKIEKKTIKNNLEVYTS